DEIDRLVAQQGLPEIEIGVRVLVAIGLGDESLTPLGADAARIAIDADHAHGHSGQAQRADDTLSNQCADRRDDNGDRFAWFVPHSHRYRRSIGPKACAVSASRIKAMPSRMPIRGE